MAEPVTTTAALLRRTAQPSVQSSTANEEYLPAWSYITIVQKTIETQTMLVEQHPMF